jgi:hypothetical protein
MIDITSREDAVQPQGVIDLEPYLEANPHADYAGTDLLSEAHPAVVYRSEDVPSPEGLSLKPSMSRAAPTPGKDKVC